ncbi:MAG TPA: dockerin type I domain-containing protein [Fimbriimonadaceae bacterium]|nr:dockerin type I domain-containing protein [Fimbriimonadaceae bacterium]HRJ96809.1 dockerin type I domain-containing protein [Fimbriimonadaceae bacterium]
MSNSSRCAIACGLLLPAAAYAQFSWQAAVSGFWSTPASWLGNVSPNNSSGGSDVFIDFAPFALTGGNGNFTTTLDYNVTIRNLYSRANFVFAGSQLSLGQALSQVDGSFTFQSGTILGGGITFNGASSFPGAVDRIINASQVAFMGPTTYGGGALYCVNSTLTYGNTFTVVDGRSRDGVHNITSSGALVKTSGSGDFFIAESWNGGPRQLNVTGRLEAQSGRIIPTTGGTHSGHFYGNGGTILLSNGTHTMLAGSKFEDGVVVEGASISLPGAGDTLQILGDPEYRSGQLGGAGKLIGPGSLNLTTAGAKGINGSVRNEVNFLILGGEVYGVNSTFTNASYVQLDGPRRWRDGIFNNEGLVQKTGAGQAFMGEGWSGGPTQLNNHGSMESLGGSLSIVTSGTHTGSFKGLGGTIDFSTSTHRFDPGHSLYSGVNLNSGTFQVPSDEMLNCMGAVKFFGGILTSVGANPAFIDGPGSLDIEGSVSIGGSHRLATVLNWNAGTVSAVNSTFTNEDTLYVNTSNDWRDGIFNNSGTLTKTGAGTTVLSQPWSGGPRQVNNSGTLLAQAGNLIVRAGGTHSGLFHGNGGTIEFPSESQVFNSGTVLRGNVLLNGCTANIPGSQSVVLDGTTWNAGTLQGTGTITGPAFLWTGSANLGQSLLSLANIEVNAATRFNVNSGFTNQATMLFSGTCLWRDGILVNNGIIRSTSGSTSLNENWSGGPRQTRNNGVIEADASTISLMANGEHTGAFFTENGGQIFFGAGTHTMRSGSKMGTGTITQTPMVTNERTSIIGESEWRSSSWGGTGVIDGDLWRWTTGASKLLQNHLKCEADISHEGGDVFAVNQQFTNRGTATIGDGLSWRDGVWFNEGTLQKTAGAGTSSIGSLWSGGPRSVTNTGTLLAGSGTLQIGATLTNYAAGSQQMNGGSYAASGGGRLLLPIGTVTTNAGRFILDGPTSSVTQSNGTTSALATLATNLGGLEVHGGHVLNLPGPLANSGDVTIGVGSSIVPNGNYTQTAGLTRVNGTLPVPIVIQGGVLGGTGTANGGSTTSAIVAPGNSTGTLSIAGNLSLTNSTLDIEVASSAPGFFDRLAVSGTATIVGGALQADAAPNSTVTAGTTVDVLTAGSRSGTFTTHPNPADWSVTYGATFIRLGALRTIVGPILIEGEVDLDGWLASYSAVPLTFELRQGGSVVESHVVNPNNDRTYAISTRRRGNFQLFVVGPHWLVRQRPGTLILTDAGLTGIDLSLVNGDVDQDNEVTIGDYAMLSSAFGSGPGDPNWEPNADLDGDEEIAIGDYAILSTNFGLAGD